MLTIRRDFLRFIPATPLIAAAPRALGQGAQGSPDARSPTALSQRRIPSSGESIPVIGAGTADSFNVAPDSPEYEALAKVLQTFFAAGARVIDTSPNYGRSDIVLGQLLRDHGWRNRCFLATKIAADSRGAAEEQWTQTLRRLHTDQVELLQVHNLRAWRTQLPLARELKASGKTRYIGVTHYTASGLAELAQIMRGEPGLDFIQINYSVNATEAAREVLPLARDRGIAVLINRAFDDGRLFAKARGMALPGWAQELGIGSWAQMFLRFALSHPAVTTVIPATGKPERQADNLKAGIGPPLSAQQQRDIAEAFA